MVRISDDSSAQYSSTAVPLCGQYDAEYTAYGYGRTHRSGADLNLVRVRPY